MWTNVHIHINKCLNIDGLEFSHLILNILVLCIQTFQPEILTTDLLDLIAYCIWTHLPKYLRSYCCSHIFPPIPSFALKQIRLHLPMFPRTTAARPILTFTTSIIRVSPTPRLTIISPNTWQHSLPENYWQELSTDTRAGSWNDELNGKLRRTTHSTVGSSDHNSWWE